MLERAGARALAVAEGLRQELAPLYGASYAAAREEYGQKFAGRAHKFLCVLTFMGAHQPLVDPDPVMRRYFLVETIFHGIVLYFFPRNRTALSLAVVTSGSLCSGVRMYLIGNDWFTAGYAAKAAVVTFPLFFFMGAPCVVGWSLAQLLLLSTLSSGAPPHFVHNARAAVTIALLAAVFAEASKVREEATAVSLKERTAELRELELQAMEARAEAAQARAAQSAAEAAQARAAQLQAVDQRRAMERLYNKVLTRLKVPLVLARSELQGRDAASPPCGRCEAVGQRVNELWQLLTVPEGAPMFYPQPQAKAPAPAPTTSGAVQVDTEPQPYAGAPSATDCSAAWSLDALQDVQQITVAFDPFGIGLPLQEVTVHFKPPELRDSAAVHASQLSQLSQWVFPADWAQLEAWVQKEVNAIAAGEARRPHPGPLHLRWPADSYLQVGAAFVSYEEGDSSDSSEGGDADSSMEGSQVVQVDPLRSDAGPGQRRGDGHFVLLLSKLAIPVPSRHERRTREPRRGAPRSGSDARAVGQLDAVDEAQRATVWSSSSGPSSTPRVGVCGPRKALAPARRAPRS